MRRTGTETAMIWLPRTVTRTDSCPYPYCSTAPVALRTVPVVAPGPADGVLAGAEPPAMADGVPASPRAGWPSTAGAAVPPMWKPSTPANPATAPVTRYQPDRLIGCSLRSRRLPSAWSQCVRLVMHGLGGHPEPCRQVDDGGHEAFGPADVDVPPVQVGNQPRQGSLVKHHLLPGADQFVQPAMPVTDQVRDLLVQHQVLGTGATQHAPPERRCAACPRAATAAR